MREIGSIVGADLKKVGIQNNVGGGCKCRVLVCRLIGSKRVMAESGGGQLLDVAQLGRNAGSSETLAGVERNGGNIGHGIGSFSRIAISTVTRAFIATARPMRMVR